MANDSDDILYISNGTSGDNIGQHYESESYIVAISVAGAIALGLIMFSMGCMVEVKKLWGHIKRPWGIAVGMMCQFGLMPLTGYILATYLPVKAIQALTIFIIGCCPGGASSNLATYWVDGDMDLSISMTIFSNVAGLGTMPLYLYLYSCSWEFAQVIIVPYKTIGTELPGLVIPIACGIFVNYRWPKQSKIIRKIGSIAGVLVLIVLAVLNQALNKDFWDVDHWLLIAATILPSTGYLGGFLLARLTYQSWQRCRTIAVEIGSQNLHLCYSALQLSFSTQHFGQIFPFYTIYYVFQLLTLTVLVAVYQIYKRCLRKATAEETPADPQRKMSDNVGGEVNMGFEKDKGQPVDFKMENSAKAVPLQQI
ncbi:sodium-dependent organic anion transporter [Elgaria multicarinata webbii]|uniref:sodium-dependent organic anion transporter n=1 Tax=Elgaria multicarinata webbii TaxID=159646 RepID=UPI002FCCDD57